MSATCTPAQSRVRVQMKYTTPRSKTLEQMGFKRAVQPVTTKTPTDFAAVKSLLASHKRSLPFVAPPQVEDKTCRTYGKPDIIVTSQMLLDYLKKNKGTYASMRVILQSKAWWDMVYDKSPYEYYNLRYGANNSKTYGLVCVRCQNEKCPNLTDPENEIESLTKTSTCLSCTKSWNPFLREVKPKVVLKTKLLSLETIHSSKLAME